MRRAAARPVALLVALAVAAPATVAAQQPTALWCAPSIARSLVRLADACGRSLPPEARARADRLDAALRDAVERTRGRAALDALWPCYEAMAAPFGAEDRDRACARLDGGDLAPFIPWLSGPEGERAVAETEAAARTTADPMAGGCL